MAKRRNHYTGMIEEVPDFERALIQQEQSRRNVLGLPEQPLNLPGGLGGETQQITREEFGAPAPYQPEKLLGTDWDRVRMAGGLGEEAMVSGQVPSVSPETGVVAQPAPVKPVNIFDTTQKPIRPVAPETMFSMSPEERFMYNRRLEQAGIASTDPDALPPIAGGETYQVGRGTVTVPEGTRAPSGSLEAEMRQQWLAETAGERMAGRQAKKVIDSLIAGGQTGEQVKDAIGWTPQMSNTEVYRRVAELNNRRAGVGVTPSDARRQRTMDRIGEKAGYSTETVNGQEVSTPNQYQRALDMDSSLSAQVAMPTIEDPNNTVSLSNYLSDSQKREIDRYYNKLGRGVKSGKDEKRVMSAINQAQKAMDQDVKNKTQAYEAEVQIAKMANEANKIQAQDYQNQINAIQDKIDRTEKSWNKLDQIQLEGGGEWDFINDDGYIVNKGSMTEDNPKGDLYTGKDAQILKYNGLKKDRDGLYAQKDDLTNQQYGLFQQERGGQPTEQDHLSANEAAKAAGQQEYELGGRKYRVQ